MSGLRRSVLLIAAGVAACGLSNPLPTPCSFSLTGAVTGTVTGVNCITYTHSSAAAQSSFFTIAIVAAGTEGSVEAGLFLPAAPTSNTTYTPGSLAITDGGSALEAIAAGGTSVYAFLDGTSAGPPGGQGTFSMQVTTVEASAADSLTSAAGVTQDNLHGTLTATLPVVPAAGSDGGGVVTLTGSF